MGRSRGKLRIGLAALVAAGTLGAIPVSVTDAAVPPDGGASTFDFSRQLAIEAARVRLGRYVGANPPDAAAPTAPACPIASTDVMTAAAGTGGLQPQLDPWAAVTTSEPELRPDSTPAGQVGGLAVITCSTGRPGDGSITRPTLFSVTLRDGVSFSDVARRYGVEPILPVEPAGLGGQMVGNCLTAGTTGSCVVLWQSNRLVVGLTLEGPASEVGPSSSSAVMTAAVPQLLDELAVIRTAPAECTSAAIAADTGITLLAEPVCNDGWAVGNSAPCPTDTGCVDSDVFHIDNDGWKHNGLVDNSCAENLAALGMTGVTAQDLVPACDPDARSLRSGSMAPGSTGQRVTGLQVALIALGYELPIDGTYGPLTTAAVVDYQTRSSLIVDGRAGRQTQSALGI